MAHGLYLFPVETVVTGRGTQFVPKYLQPDPTLPPRWEWLRVDGWASQRNGLAFWTLVTADFSPEIQNLLVKSPDVFVFNPDADAILAPEEILALAAILDAMQLPIEWLTETTTWATVESALRGQFLFNQRIEGILRDTPIKGNVDLTTPLKELPSEVQDAVLAAAADRDISTDQLTEDSTLAVIYTEVAVQETTKAETAKRVEAEKAEATAAAEAAAAAESTAATAATPRVLVGKGNG